MSILSEFLTSSLALFVSPGGFCASLKSVIMRGSTIKEPENPVDTQEFSQPLPKTLAKFFTYFVRKQWPWFLLVQICWFAWSIDQTFFPVLFGKIIDAFNLFTADRGDAWAQLKWPFIGVATLWLGVEISFRVGGFTMARQFPTLEANIRLHMFHYVQQHSSHYFANQFAGSLSNKINDMAQSASRILGLIFTLFIPAGLALILATTIFYHVQPLFAVLIGGWSFVHISLCLFFAQKCARLSHLHSESRSILTGRIVDSLTNYLNCKLFARRRHEMQYITRFQQDEKIKNQQQLRYIEFIRLLLSILGTLGPGIGIFGYAYYSWLHYTISVGEVVLIFNGTWNIMFMVWITGIEIPNFFREWGICRQALTLIQAKHEITDKNSDNLLQVKQGRIVFDHVDFHYKDSPAIFERQNLTIPVGQKVGLVGYSGSGKSTFVNLILRLYDIQAGKILIDEQDISEVTQESLRESIAMIPQEPSLYHRSLMENIRYGYLSASDEQVFAAAKKSHAHEFIQQLPQQYETLVGERGVKLSGGQRQRIAIARAMLKNAPILILDEATSALDSVTESVIQESLSQLMAQRTAIVIAHRLSTLLHMDRILVFDQGKLVEDGTHEQLLTQEGHYKILWQAQVGGFIPNNPQS